MKRFDVFRRWQANSQEVAHRGNPLFVKDRTKANRTKLIKIGALVVVVGSALVGFYALTARAQDASKLELVVNGLLDIPFDDVARVASSYAEERVWNGRHRIETGRWSDDELKRRLEAAEPLTVTKVERPDGRHLIVNVTDNVMSVLVEEPGSAYALDESGVIIYRQAPEEYEKWKVANFDNPRLQRMSNLPRLRVEKPLVLTSSDVLFVSQSTDVLRRLSLPLKYFTKSEDGSGEIVSSVKILIDYGKSPAEQLSSFENVWKTLTEAEKQGLNYVDVRFGRRVYYR